MENERKMIKTLPIIRHIRYLYLSLTFHIWWASQGRYFGAVPNPSDMEYLHGVWSGKW
jgi:hypothetical protein